MADVKHSAREYLRSLPSGTPLWRCLGSGCRQLRLGRLLSWLYFLGLEDALASSLPV